MTKIQKEAARILAMPEVRDRLPPMGASAVGSTPDEFDARFRRDVDQYAKTIKAAGIPQVN